MPFKNTYIQLNTHPLLPVNPTGSDDETFGILVLEMNEVNITTRPLFILFTLDTTGSMSEYVTHSTTKIQYAVQTLKSIVKYLSTLEVDIYIQINTFNDNVATIVPPTKVSIQSQSDLINILNTVDADGTTNIELALKSANTSITEYAKNHSTTSCVHIFMTDGEPTSGATTSNELLDCISSDYMSINIGFGIDHNAKLLCDISNMTNSEYHFIDNIEHASLVYCESLHKVLYPSLRNARIHIENGFVYDWLDNEWKTCITENIIVGEIKKYYHVKTNMKNTIKAQIEAYREDKMEDNNSYIAHVDENILQLPELIDNDGNIIHDLNVVKFAFRQCILELFYESKQLNRYTNIDTVHNIKWRIKEIYSKLHMFADENNMKTDGVIKQLLNDLYLAYWNIGMDNGAIYIHGRHTSQGNQHAYTPGNNQLHMHTLNNVLDIPPTPVIRRFNNGHPRNDWTTSGPNIFTNSLDLYESITGTSGTTDNEYSSYSTPSIRRTAASIQSYDA